MRVVGATSNVGTSLLEKLAKALCCYVEAERA